MYPSLKIAQGDNFQSGSISYLFQRIKPSNFAKFRAVVLKYNRDVMTLPLKFWSKVPQSKIEKGEIFS